MAFDLEYQAAKQAVDAITNPTVVAIEALKLAADNTVNGLSADLETKASQIEKLQAQLADLQAQPQVVVPNLVNGATDMNLHLDWRIGTGSDIAPLNGGLMQGTDYGFKTKQSKAGSPATAVELYFNRAIAGDYSGFLISLHRDINPRVAKLIWKGRFFHDDRALNGMQALEFDTLVTADDVKYNLSSQINYAKSGMLQIVNDADGSKNWEDSGIVLGKPSSNVWHDFQWEYWYDTNAKQFGYTAFTLDGVRHPITQAEYIQEIPTSPGWGTNLRLHTQLQIGTNSKGLPFSVAFDRLSYFTT